MTADVTYAIGLLTVPCIIGLLAAVWYARRGWPRGTGPVWHARVRQAVAVLIGLYTLGQVANIVANGAGNSSPSTTSTPMGAWSTMHMTRYIKPIGDDLRALKRAEAAHSWVGINNACGDGVARADIAGSQPNAPNARFQTLYHAWLVDVFEVFTHCEDASMTHARWLSAAGANDWAKAMSYATAADKVYARVIAYGDTLKM
jgi:hypothetical protein